LVDFVESVGECTVPTECIKHVSPQDGVLPPTAFVILYFTVANHIRDIAMLAAVMQVEVIMPLVAQRDIDKDKVVTFIPSVMHRFGECLANLESELAQGTVQDLQSSGWRGPQSFACIRAWQACMAKFLGECIKLILQVYSQHLSDLSLKAKSACPSWDACVSGEAFNLDLAKKLLSGKVAVVIKAHNELHAAVEKLSQAGDQMQVSPRLQVNDVTAGAVTVALHTLHAARTTTIVIQGVECLNTYANHHLGPKKCNEFLAQVPADVKTAIPAVFWTMFEAIAKESSIGGKGGMNPAAVKQEVVKAECASELARDSGVGSVSGSSGLAKPAVDQSSAAASSSVRSLKRRRVG
jgi:hypothetical protein